MPDDSIQTGTENASLRAASLAEAFERGVLNLADQLLQPGHVETLLRQQVASDLIDLSVVTGQCAPLLAQGGELAMEADRRVDAAHRRFLASSETLARVQIYSQRPAPTR